MPSCSWCKKPCNTPVASCKGSGGLQTYACMGECRRKLERSENELQGSWDLCPKLTADKGFQKDLKAATSRTPYWARKIALKLIRQGGASADVSPS
jgi:hypothetical protein